MDTLRRAFDADGYVALRQFIRERELAELTANVDRFVRDVAPTMPPEHVFYENKNEPATLKQLQRLGDYDKWFGELFRDGPFRAVAERLLRGPVVPKNMQYFNKPPKAGKPSPAHQDGYYFMLKPNHALSFWIALEDVDEETGCVRLLHHWLNRRFYFF